MAPNTTAQRMWLTHHAERFHGFLGRLTTERAVERLWAQDAGLWTADPAVQRAIRNRLGWLTIAQAMRPQLERLGRLREELREAGVTRMPLLGMGGSAFFAEVCRSLFGVAAAGIDVQVLDTTDPTAISAARQRTPPASLGAIISSKSGSTIEVQSLAAYFLDALRASGHDPAARCVVITDAGTPLEAQAKTWGVRRVFAQGPGQGAEVGGRFSALAFFGLVPAALIGADPGHLLRRAEAMLEACAPGVPLADNPAAQLAALLATMRHSGQDKLTLLVPPDLAGVGAWIEQMIAESLGKQGQGLIPITGEPRREPSAYGRDRVFVELQVAERWDEELDRRARALAAAEHPVLRIHWQDRYDMGGEVMRWAVASALAGFLLEINPFDEPNVQESKDRTRQLLDGLAPGQQLAESGPPLCADGNLTVYGQPAGAPPPTVADALRGLLEGLQPSDFLAILSFLPRTETLDARLRMLRERLAAHLQPATMLQHGPRYLHSTGQLFKGGPPAGAFLVLTADEKDDLPIPGAPYTFGTLKQAQALGDVQAMRQRGRRLLHARLKRPEAALPELVRMLDQATAPR